MHQLQQASWLLSLSSQSSDGTVNHEVTDCQQEAATLKVSIQHSMAVTHNVDC